MRQLSELTLNEQATFVQNVMLRLKRAISVTEMVKLLRNHYAMSTTPKLLEYCLNLLWFRGDVERVWSRDRTCFKLGASHA